MTISTRITVYELTVLKERSQGFNNLYSVLFLSTLILFNLQFN